jgi:hypothetical protein
LTELKYAISIRDDYEFMRRRLHIYYEQKTLRPTAYQRRGVKHYTPDFLIRHKATHEAWLVEIKPRAFEHQPQLAVRQQVAENYIRWKQHDWKYKVVFDDEIFLNEIDWGIFEDCCRLKSKSAFKIWLERQNRLYDRSAPLFFTSQLTSRQIAFVMFGSHLPRSG